MKLANIPLISNLVKAYQRWQSDDGSLMAAAVAYYAALSFFPLLLVLISGLGLLLEFTQWGSNAQDQILMAVGEYASPAVRDAVARMMNQVQDKASLGGPVGLGMLLIGAAAMFAHFDQAFSRIWNVPDPPSAGIWRTARRIVFVRLRAFLMLIALGVLIVVIFAVGMTLSSLKQFSSQWIAIPQWAWWTVEIVVSVALNAGVFTLLYRLLPRVAVQWREAARGGALAAAVWEIGRQTLAAFVVSSKYSAYGVVGSFIAVMLWIYFAVTVLFLAAEYVQVICKDCKSQKHTPGNTP